MHYSTQLNVTLVTTISFYRHVQCTLMRLNVHWIYRHYTIITLQMHWVMFTANTRRRANIDLMLSRRRVLNVWVSPVLVLYECNCYVTL